MKRLLLILISVFALLSASWAGQITREQAFRKAQQFLSQKGLSRSLSIAEPQATRARAKDKGTPDCYYVFNAGENQGFVIISGDDSTEDVLGYSTSGTFDLNNLPPAMEALLNYYSAQISMIQQGRAQAAPKRASHPAVSQLMTVKWDQKKPYNDKTPLGYYSNSNTGEHCVTGCVATAMAQVLYHQQFVNSTQAEIPGYTNYWYWQPPSGEKKAVLEAIPSGSVLDWENMIDNYETGSPTQIQKDAVATLMLYCGQAVEMMYNIAKAGGSSASNSSIPEALKKYFGYSRGTRYITRSDYSDDEWDNIIYNEIAEGRPVIYGGVTKSKEGHSFIVHGYDGAGKYAINWGWGGYQDNYFTLDNLTPDDQGTGGSSVGEGFNFEQDAVVRLAKEDGTFSEQVRLTTESLGLGSQSVFVKIGSQFHISFKAKFVSKLVNTYDISYNYAIYKDGTFMEYLNPNGPIQTFESFSPTTYFPDNGEISMYLPYYDGNTLYNAFRTPGKYKIVPVSREASSTEWLENEGSDTYYLTAVCTDTKLTLYVGEPTVGTEVSDADRAELTNTYNTLKNAVEAKQTAVAANETKINTLKASVAEKKTSIIAIDATIASISAKLTEDTYLSESEKTKYQTQLTTLDAQKTQLSRELTATEATVSTLETNNNTLKTQIAALLSDINEQMAVIATITTTEALNASKAKAAELTTTANGYDVASVTTEITAAETRLNALSLSGLQTDLSDLNNAIDVAIEKAKIPEVSDADRAELTNTYNTLKNAVEAKQTAVAANETKINSLKASVAEKKTSITAIDATIASISTKLTEDTYLPESEKTKYQTQLTTLDAQKTRLSGELTAIEATVSTLETNNNTLKTQIAALLSDINEQMAAIATITTTEALNASKAKAAELTTTANGYDVASVTAEITTAETSLNALSLSGLQSDLTDLNTTVDAAIQTAKAAYEEEKAKAEKLAKAKEECSKAVDALTEVINAQTAKYDEILANLEHLNMKLVEIDGYIKDFQAKAKEISDMIDQLKSPSTARNRAAAEDIIKFEDALAKLNEHIGKLSESKTKLDQQIKSIEALRDKTKQMIDEATELRDKIQSDYADATSIEDVEAMTTQVTAETSDLNSEEAESINALIADINAEIAAVEADIDTIINIDVANVTKEAEDLNNEVATGINGITIDENDILGRYDLNGRPVDANYKGVMIIRMTNGNTKTIIKR